jgi:hypothetical protein
MGGKTGAPLFVALFLSILFLNSWIQIDQTLTLTYFPSVSRENEPFVVRALVRNVADEPRRIRVTLFVDGLEAFVSESFLEPLATQSSTLTLPSPKLGTAIRFYAEAVDLETGARFTEAIMVPQSPPEAWMSFASFSSLTTMLLSSSSSSSLMSSSSSSSMSSSFTISYYQSTIGLARAPVKWGINVGLAVSIILLVLLTFIELTNPRFGTLGRRLSGLRDRYSLLTANLLLIFMGLVITRIVMIIAG